MQRNSTPYGLKIIQSCSSCPVREERLFCDLGPEALAEQDVMRQTAFYPKGALLFVEGQAPRGIYVLCSGSAKLTVTSNRGGVVIMHVAETGEVLGLSAVISGGSHEASAETIEPTEASFLPRESFLSYLERHGDVALRVAQQLSHDLRRAHHTVARIALAPNARAKLAGLILDWANHRGRREATAVSFSLCLTHEEIGEFIGSSRETVTRLIGDFRREGLIETHGVRVTVRNAAGLETILC